MSDSTETLSVEAVLAITDPGEVNRDSHTKVDRFVINVGNVVAWAFPLLMVAIVSQVILRASGYNQAWLDDLQWWIYGFAMLTAFGYAIVTVSHVRVDIFHQYYNPERKARIEAFALGWLLIPFLAMMTDVMFHYAVASIESGEGSSSPNGLHRLYILKTAMPFLFVLALMASYSGVRKNMAIFTSVDWPRTLIWVFPSAVFVLWRTLHYLAYWAVALTDSETATRRITREYAMFEYLHIAAFVAVIVVIIAGLAMGRKKDAT
ncbi:MAG: TRAP transporter small permease subunit [Pseudomonadota bacterium]